MKYCMNALCICMCMQRSWLSNRPCYLVSMDDEEEDQYFQELERVTGHRVKQMAEDIQTTVEWGLLLRSTKMNNYYSSVHINNKEVQVGDCVSVPPSDPSSAVYIGRISVSAGWQRHAVTCPLVRQWQ